MSIFRVEKNKNYTVISNYHLRDKNLSLKTIGLLSLILSLTEEWDYTQAGLAAIVKDGEDSVRSGLKELEKFGYLERERERDENGRMRGTIYKIYEIPKKKREELGSNTEWVGGTADQQDQDEDDVPGTNRKNTAPDSPKKGNSLPNSPELDKPTLESPTLENPILVNPTLDNPKQESPMLENQSQISKDILNKDLLNTDIPNNLSIYPSGGMKDGMMDEAYLDALKDVIKEQVGYDYFERKCQEIEKRFYANEIGMLEYESELAMYDITTLNQVLGYMMDVLTSLNTDPIKIGDELISRNAVKNKLRKVNLIGMKRVIFELKTNSSIKNPKKYAISMLYNSING